MRPFWPAVATILVLSPPPAARADAVTDQIDQAVAAYKKQDLATAIAALDAAASLIRQQKAEAWKTVLPPPLPGWTADEPQGRALPPALLGGGTTVSRTFHKAAEAATVTIMADSPLVQALAGLMASSIGSLIAGSQVLVIDGRRVLYGKDENSYQTLVANRVLVKVEGTHGVDDPTLRQYLKAVKFDEIEKMAK